MIDTDVEEFAALGESHDVVFRRIPQHDYTRRFKGTGGQPAIVFEAKLPGTDALFVMVIDNERLGIAAEINNTTIAQTMNMKTQIPRDEHKTVLAAAGTVLLRHLKDHRYLPRSF